MEKKYYDVIYEKLKTANFIERERYLLALGEARDKELIQKNIDLIFSKEIKSPRYSIYSKNNGYPQGWKRNGLGIH